MKKIIIPFAAASIVISVLALRTKESAVSAGGKNQQLAGAFQSVAVLELFTSQGCSSCPSADRLLGRTIEKAKQEGKNVFALSFHVDYWNRLGWPDPFSKSEYSNRQSEYASQLKLSSVYTPQMIVNGSREFVGSDEPELKEAIYRSLNTAPAAAFALLSAEVKNNPAPKVKYILAGNYQNCSVHFALVSLSETTAIKRGENGGLTLKNENIVRQFITVPATADGEISFKNDPLPAETNMAIIAFIQNNSDLKITGAAKAEIK